jgi:hypothetical protein
MFAYRTLVTQRKCAENIFMAEESTSPVKQQKMGGSVTVLPEFLGFHLLLYTAYSRNVSIFKSRPLPVAGSFTVTA